MTPAGPVCTHIKCMHGKKKHYVHKRKQTNLKPIETRKKVIANSAFLSASYPEDLGAWESDILCLTPATRNSGGSDCRPPPSMSVS